MWRVEGRLCFLANSHTFTQVLQDTVARIMLWRVEGMLCFLANSHTFTQALQDTVARIMLWRVEGILCYLANSHTFTQALQDTTTRIMLWKVEGMGILLGIIFFKYIWGKADNKQALKIHYNFIVYFCISEKMNL